jgi:hypothetical protein
MKTALLALLLAALVTPAFAASDWNGTWVGNWADNGDGVQIMMAGNTATGLYWHGDYVPDDLHASVSPDGNTLTITWAKSRAVLTRDGVETARVVMHEPGKPDAAFAVKIDH